MKNSDIKSITVGEYCLIPEFCPVVYEYTVYLPCGRPRIPEIKVECSESKNLEIRQATLPDDKEYGIATVKTEDNKIYSIKFVKTKEKGFRLQYDDRYIFTPESKGKYIFESSNSDVVSVDEKGQITAKAISCEPTFIYAIQNGKTVETFKIDKVEKASINIFLITGQSNANGCYDLATDKGSLQLSVEEQLKNCPRPDGAGKVYSYNAACNKYTRVYETGAYPLDELYDLSGHSCNGFGPSLAVCWYNLTGEKTVLCQTGRNATAIEVWMKGGPTWRIKKLNLYDETLKAYNAVLSQLGENYSVNRVINFWLQGETCMTKNFKPDYGGAGVGNWDPDDTSEKMGSCEYYEKFMEIDKCMRSDFRIEYNCILLVRNKSGAVLNPIRAAQYALNNRNKNILLVSRVCDYVRMASDEDKTSYGYAFIGLDNTHYNQIGYNEQGRTAAMNLYRHICSENIEKLSANGLEIIDRDGKKRLQPESEICIGIGEEYQIVAFSLPEYTCEMLTYGSSDERVAIIDKFGKIKGISKGKTNIKATSESGKTEYIKINVV